MLKGLILPDHAAKNKYTLSVNGMVDLTVTMHGNIEEELKTVDLPDNTKASGGDSNPVEFTFSIPLHHAVEVLALEEWWLECKNSAPTYKRPATLTYKTASETAVRSYFLDGMFLTKRNLPDSEMGNDGEAQLIEWTASADSVEPLP
jgi:hypothetical protein